jgi:branched-chain amino acid transport system ATP-binding protein
VEERLESALDSADSVMILERGRMVRKGAGQTLRSDHELVERSIGVGSLHEG